MSVKHTIFAVLVAFLVLAVNPAFGAVDTREIDKIREKGVLDGEDLQIIDDFVADVVQVLVKTTDFTSIAKARTVILARDSSVTSSAAAQYAEQFSESAYKYISSGLKAAERLRPQGRRVKVIMNLLILIDGLEDPRLADLAIEKLNNENIAICYWAVHSVTNPGITKKLNFTGVDNLKLAKRITEQLAKQLRRASPEIMALMAGFAADVDIPQGKDLLLQIADKRISQYADWTVDYELLDATILKLLYRKMSSAGLGESAIARRFAQLYSCAIQRYVKGQDFLSAAQKNQLVSVLVETEKSCIGKLLDVPQSIIQKAIEQGDVTSLLLEHNRLFGDETRAGELASKLGFDYGKTSNGGKLTTPPALPWPPKTETSK